MVLTSTGFSKEEVDRLTREGKLSKDSRSQSRSQSVSSLDQEDTDTDTLRKVKPWSQQWNIYKIM